MIDPVIVLGTGRSGTSLVAGLLHEMGFFMGYELNMGANGNPKGTFEDQDIMFANRELHSVWPGGIDNILKRREELNIPWGFKDPFTLHRLDYYTQRYPHAKYIACKRDMRDVIKSITEASGQEFNEEVYKIEQGNLFYQRNEILDNFLKQGHAYVVNFEDMVTKPEPVIDGLVDFLEHPVSNIMKQKLYDFVIRR